MKLSDHDQGVIRLILRSPDRGDGWRHSAPEVWKQFIKTVERKELLETDDENMMVRLSKVGQIVANYL